MNRFSAILLTLLLFGSFSTLRAQEAPCPCTVSTVSGSITSDGAPVVSGATLQKNDTIVVGAGATLTLAIGDAASVIVGPDSRLAVDVTYCTTPTSGSVRLRLLEGSMWAKGTAAAPKVELTTLHALATLGTATMTLTSDDLDTNFTISKGSQEISTRDWVDTVEVETYTFPFKGTVSTIATHAGSAIVLPWGGRGAMLKAGTQVTYGYKEEHISSKPTPIVTEQMVFDAEGAYTAGK